MGCTISACRYLALEICPKGHTHATQLLIIHIMSRIDLMCMFSFLNRVQGVSMLPRGILDHTPVSLQMYLTAAPEEVVWGLSCYWNSDLNIDANIFAKLLANRLKGVISSLIQSNQSRFLSEKGMDTNIQ